jgi:hypothetical protein
MQEYQVTNKSTNWVQDESLKSEGRQHVGHQRAHRPCRWPVHLPQGRHVVSTQTCPPWGLSFSCSVDLEVRPPWLPNKQSRRNRAGDRQQPLPSVPIKQGDLGDERRKLSMPTQFRIATDANKYMFLLQLSVLGIKLLSICTVAFDALVSPRPLHEATPLESYMLRAETSKPEWRRWTNARRWKENSSLGSLVGNSSWKWQGFGGAKVASWNRRIGRVWPPVTTHKPGSTYLQIQTLSSNHLCIYVNMIRRGWELKCASTIKVWPSIHHHAMAGGTMMVRIKWLTFEQRAQNQHALPSPPF